MEFILQKAHCIRRRAGMRELLKEVFDDKQIK